ncbi:hypothetical protein Q4595_00470 [Wenyingzhuangia sp. 1_MG-2023]|nr:hypothetical protein [Wenyingzhuangia sp. 1_MG-2023]
MFQKIIFFFLLILLMACNKQEFNQQKTLVPYTAVNTTTNPFDPTFISNTGVGGYTIITGQGYNANGIIVFNLGNNYFLAFDLTCPYIDPEECTTSMSVNTSGKMSCDNCTNDNITFTQYNTSATVNGQTYSLRQYSAILEGNAVRITNF